MLIASDRHTTKDLALWREWEQADRAHSSSAEFYRHAADAKDCINAFHRRPKPYYLGVSWGKDSVVLLHMFYALGFRPRVVYVRQLDNENPESEKVRDAFLARFPLDQYEEVAYSYRDASDDWFINGRPGKWFRVLTDLQRQYGIHVTGVRADESSKRALRFASHGVESRWSFAPFRRFTVADVFAYLALFKLPAHPNYAMLGGGRWDRQRLRVTALGNREGSGIGRGEWEREYFGDQLRKMQADKIMSAPSFSACFAQQTRHQSS